MGFESLQELWGDTPVYEKKHFFIPDGTFVAQIRDAGIDTDEETGRQSVFFRLYAPAFGLEETAWMRLIPDEKAVKALKTNLDRIGALPANVNDLPAALAKTIGWTISANKKSRAKDTGVGYWRSFYFNNKIDESTLPADTETESELPF